MSDPFIGEIRMFAGNFAPDGWLPCDGRQMQINDNPALYSLLGITFGGDGRTNFNLPDYRGRGPVGMGQGTGLDLVQQGQKGGQPTVTLNALQLPGHDHNVSLEVAGTATNPATAPTSTNKVLGASGSGPGSASIWSSEMASPVAMAPTTTSVSGNSQPVDIRNPYLGTLFIIATTGIYPSRP